MQYEVVTLRNHTMKHLQVREKDNKGA